MGAINTIKKTISGIFTTKNDPEKDQIQPDELTNIYDGPTKDEVIGEITDKFDQSSEDRIAYELQWQLNTNFALGNQYCDINPSTQEIIEIYKAFGFQEREVFNHIAPIVETREAKLSRVRPSMTVRPATNDHSDISTAKVSTAVVKATQRKTEMPSKLTSATGWSELTGTVFFKNTWDHGAGKLIGYMDGKAIAEGDISNYVVPPYEIFPESPFASMEGQKWIIHQKSYHEDDVEDIWGKRITGKDIEVYSLGQTATGSTGGLGYNVTVPFVVPTMKKTQVIVREYYERPSRRYPEGRMIIIAEDELLFYGSLPYKNGKDGKREFPFTRQVCIENPGCFWGTSIIERLIPIQRRYNAVKNRKQEYLNRITFGIVDVEEGAYDIDLSEGLPPGLVLERKRGFAPAKSLDFGNSSLSEFNNEEASLINEFILISGVSELSRNSAAPTGAGSGIALEILKEQDETRLSLTAEHIRHAVLLQAQVWIRLYRQFAIGPRMDRLVGDNSDVLVAQWTKNDLSSDDIAFDTENELIQSPAQRRQQVYDMLGQGLFNDAETGRINKRSKSKIFEMLEMGNWEAGQGIDELHIKKAQRENIFLEQDEMPEIREYDDDTIHMEEHIAFMLGGDYEELRNTKPEMANVIEMHLKQHEQSMMFKAQKAAIQQQQAQMMAMPQQAQRQQQVPVA